MGKCTKNWITCQSVGDFRIARSTREVFFAHVGKKVTCNLKWVKFWVVLARVTLSLPVLNDLEAHLRTGILKFLQFALLCPVIFFPSQILLKIILDGCPKLKGSILSSALLCMVDIVYDNSKNYGISFAKEKTSENKGVCKRKTSWIKNWNSFPWWDSNLQNLDCSLTLIQEPKLLGRTSSCPI